MSPKKPFGTNPSRASASITRGWLSISTSSTDVMPVIAPACHDTGSAVAAAIPTAALATAPAVDPIFNLIEAHRKAHAAHMASLELLNRFERRYGAGHGSWISTKPCHAEDDAFVAFVAAPAAGALTRN